MELLDDYLLGSHGRCAASVFCVIGADDPSLSLKFPLELGPRIGDQDVDREAEREDVAL